MVRFILLMPSMNMPMRLPSRMASMSTLVMKQVLKLISRMARPGYSIAEETASSWQEEPRATVTIS